MHQRCAAGSGPAGPRTPNGARSIAPGWGGLSGSRRSRLLGKVQFGAQRAPATIPSVRRNIHADDITVVDTYGCAGHSRSCLGTRNGGSPDGRSAGRRRVAAGGDRRWHGADHRAIENYITIEGKAEKRIEPTALRLVLAIMIEKPDSPECETACREMEETLVKALEDLKIERDAIVVDFISILPVYEWKVEDRQGRTVAMETRSGFRMQSNVHVEVPTEEKARDVLQTAFRLGVSDVIAFDYWNEDVDLHKKEARKEALAAAKDKAELLLGALFDQPPRPLNVHESTRVVYPRSLYDSFENAYNEQVSPSFSDERLTRIWAAKPKNAYYRGFQEDTDVQGEGLPLRPEISIVSTVRLYYATPGLKANK